jgi:hypothetical protein
MTWMIILRFAFCLKNLRLSLRPIGISSDPKRCRQVTAYLYFNPGEPNAQDHNGYHHFPPRVGCTHDRSASGQ